MRGKINSEIIGRITLTVLILMSFIVNIPAQSRFKYPASKKVDQVDTYHGVRVSDPYRWLEDGDSAETKAWIDEQNKLTTKYLDTIPQRARIRKRLTELWNYEKFSAPFKAGKNYFYFKNNGLQNQDVLYITDSPKNEGRVFLDPNKLSADGTAALYDFSFTHDGRLMAYGVAIAGSDRSEWRVKDVSTGKDLPDIIPPNRQYNFSWLHDGSGFFYSAFKPSSASQVLKETTFENKLYFHQLGTPAEDDSVVYERPDNREYFVGGFVTEDGNWLVISVNQGTGPQSMVYVKNLTMSRAPIMPVVDKLENDYTYAGNDESNFWFRTDRDAPRGKLVKVNILESKLSWQDVVVQNEDTLQGVSFINNQFVLNYLKDAYTQIRIVDVEGKPVREVALPGIGTAGGFGGKRFDSETFYSYSSFNAPQTIYRYDMKSGKSEIFRQSKVAFNPSDFEVKQIKYASKDGTMVPMFLVHKKGLKLNGSNPTLLYGYGGFNISLTPSFSVSRVVWMEMGGVLAVANLRGGAEYGEEWHAAGTKLRKQNVFDDFIAAAEWLVANKYTNSKRLAIQGGSNGGLLVGAVLNQRPDLFGAALPAVGVMDMLRFPKFTIGWAWTSDYGSPENKTEFEALFKYSPLHNVKPMKYPAVLVTTADHDDRVFPAHSFKYAAALQAAQKGTAPVMIRIETKAGHGAGKPTSKLIDEAADIYGFLFKNLGMK